MPFKRAYCNRKWGMGLNGKSLSLDFFFGRNSLLRKEVDEALGQVAQGSCRCLIPGIVQDEAE